jgi:hypothetical protein
MLRLRTWTWVAFFFFAGVAARADAPSSPSFCAEWIRQSREGYERVILFADQTLVWKTRRGGGQEDVRRKKLDAEESKFYCEYFGRSDFWSLAPDFRTRLNAEFVSESVITITRPDGSRKETRFDELSTLSPDAAALRAALEGLRALFTRTIAPQSKFTPETLSPGTLLTRFDGAIFRVRRIDLNKGVAELEGVSEPFSVFRKIEELRFQFQPPESASK